MTDALTDLIQQYRRRQTVRSVLWKLMLAAPALALMVSPTMNSAADGLVLAYRKAARIYGPLGAVGQLLAVSQPYVDESAPPAEGEIVGNYRVSSDFGPRETANLPPGASAMHRGVDLATPTGTPVYVPGQLGDVVETRCWWDEGGGGWVIDLRPQTGPHWYQALHLSDCTGLDGTKTAGEVVAYSGSSGIGAEHLDFRKRLKATDEHVPPGRKLMEDVVSGVEDSPILASSSVLSDEQILCGIGLSEGTRDSNCNPTAAYYWHEDPGNGANNLGTFSYQHGAASPEEADRLQLDKIRRFEQSILTRFAAEGLTVDPAKLLNALDLYNQSEAAAEEPGGYVEQWIVEARSQSYIDPATGKLDAPGLGGDMDRVREDQDRRHEALMQGAKLDPDAAPTPTPMEPKP